MNQYLLAIDAGTGSIRAVIFDTEGNQISVGQTEWIHQEDPKFPGSMDFDIPGNYELMIGCIGKAVADSGIAAADIVAVSSTSMREGIVLYDDEGSELWACANVDARSSNEVRELSAMPGDIESEIYRKSGQTFSLGSIARILWVKNNLPEVYARIATVTMLNDWINFKLSGKLCVDPSNGCTSGFFSAESRSWDDSIAAKCGVKTGIFPPVYEAGTPIGPLLPEIAEITGLSPECLVVAGGGDAQIGSAGVGAVKPGQAALFGGSFWQLEYNIGGPVADPAERVRLNCHCVPGVWQHEMIAFFPGLVMRWFRDAFCRLEKLMEEESGIDAYILLDKQAAKVPVGSHGLVCSFSSVMNYRSWKHGAACFTNFQLDPETFNKGSFYRALLENAALVTYAHLSILNELNDTRIEEITFASGASKSRLWCRIVSDVLGVRIKIPKVKEAAALGTVFCAGVGAGIYPSIESAAEEFVEVEAVYEPDPRNHEAYMDLFETWRKVNENQLENSDKGLLTHLWKAPGI